MFSVRSIIVDCSLQPHTLLSMKWLEIKDLLAGLVNAVVFNLPCSGYDVAFIAELRSNRVLLKEQAGGVHGHDVDPSLRLGKDQQVRIPSPPGVITFSFICCR